MDIGRCNVVYLDRRSQTTGLVKRDDVLPQSGRTETTTAQELQDKEAVTQNLRVILETFNDVYVCADGQTCLRRLSQMDDPVSQPPTILLIDIPDAEEGPVGRPLAATSSYKASSVEKGEPIDLYGIHMLSHVCSSIQQRIMSRLVIPVAVTVNPEAAQAALREEPSLWALSKCSPDSIRGVKYLDIGAADVLTSPLSSERVKALTVHAYRTFKDHAKEDTSSILTKRNRKLSWIGVDEERPFAYMREAMVSGLMVGICNPETVNDAIDPSDLKLEDTRKTIIEHAVGQWSFSAHDFTSDELVYAARVMLQHAFATPELQQWGLPTYELTIFIMACRKAYNDFVLYHNFRHVVDVLQAIFFFLLKIGLLPPYQVEGNPAAKPSNAVAAVLKPFDALTLLVSALGHDVGHPGVNNAFLVALNAPLAQLYNDRSVLEAFHCAAYSQILRKYWPSAFSNAAMRKLMITSILATDMSLHFKYMKEMGALQETIAAARANADGWVPSVTEENRDLLCGLLIKCADISNVARKYACAAQWARVLTDEFANQGAMEKELELPTCLFGGPPDPNDFLKLAQSQLGFMNIFARPLFEGISAVLPEMRFTLAELGTNKAIWQERIEAETSRKMSFIRGPLSPMSRSTTTTSETDSVDHKERLSPALGAIDSQSVEMDQPRSKLGMEQTTDQTLLGSPNANASVTSIDTSRTPVLKAGHGFTGAALDSDIGYDPRAASTATATSIYSDYPSAYHGGDSTSRPASPSKSVISTSRNHQSVPSTRSQTTSVAGAAGESSPSTKASSVEEDMNVVTTMRATSIGETTFRHSDPSNDLGFLKHDSSGVQNRSMKTMSVVEPHVLAKVTASSLAKNRTVAQMSSDDGDEIKGDGRPDLRSSRSQSRLRGLKFWKKPKEVYP